MKNAQLRDRDSGRRIWWLASFPKSGNTWVRLFVHCYETRYPLNINAGYSFVVGDQRLELYQHVACKPLSVCTTAELIYLRPSMLIHYIQLRDPCDVYFKTHNANVTICDIPLIPKLLTKGAVYLVRDPRDVAVSYAKHCGISIDECIDRMCSADHVGMRDTVADIILSWSDHVTSWMESQFPVTAIRYEDLVSDPETGFRRILPALGFNEIDEDAFQFALDQTRLQNLQKQESTEGFKEAKNGMFFGVGKAGSWKNVLTDKQVEKIEETHGEVMQKFGYELSLVNSP